MSYAFIAAILYESLLCLNLKKENRKFSEKDQKPRPYKGKSGIFVEDLRKNHHW